MRQGHGTARHYMRSEAYSGRRKAVSEAKQVKSGEAGLGRSKAGPGLARQVQHSGFNVMDFRNWTLFYSRISNPPLFFLVRATTKTKTVLKQALTEL